MSADIFGLRHWVAATWQQWMRRWPLSIFERVILVNSVIMLLETLAGWWITQHNPETYHYLIDTGFIALAALLGMAINFLVLRAAFAPLHGLLATIQAVEAGDLEARAVERTSDAEVWALARTFNAMLHRLALARSDAAGRVLRAQEEERRRLALELHDQIGQSLTALTFHAEAIAQRLEGEPSRVAEHVQRQVERLIALAQRTLAEVQTLSRQLRPPLLDDLGLVAALHWLADDVRERFGVQVHLHLHLAQRGPEAPHEQAEEPATTGPDVMGSRIQDEPARLPGDVEIALFRIAQESLTNAIRHGRAGHIHLILWQRVAGVSLMVADDGVGFTQGSTAARGIGLEGMRERAQLLGGTLRLRSRHGDGCVVRVHIPLTDVAALTVMSTGEVHSDLLLLDDSSTGMGRDQRAE